VDQNSFSHFFFFLPTCWKPESVFSGGGIETKSEKAKELKTLALSSRVRVFRLLLFKNLAVNFEKRVASFKRN
jgi:hypothetical protein